MISGDAIPQPLTDLPGDSARGAELFAAREGGHCVLCHRVEGLEAPFQGNVGPELSAVGARLSPAQMRLRIADPTRLWPDTVMPSYYRVTQLQQVGAAYRGEPVLSAQEIEDVIAYLATLEG
jgi:L-cysteine S-thiosulfotransferase